MMLPALVLEELAKENQCNERYDAVGDPMCQERIDLAVLGEIRKAQVQGIIDENDGKEAGDERAQVVTPAEPNADRTTDQHKEKAATGKSGAQMQLHTKRAHSLFALVLSGS